MIIGNGTVITSLYMGEIIEDGAIRIDNGLITHVRNTQKLKKLFPDEKIYDVKGKIIMPGIINLHTHLYSAFARGISGVASSSDFIQILENMWWRLDKALREKDIYLSALTGICEAIKLGITTLVDHHASPYSVSGSLDLIAKAFEKVGLRGMLAYEVSDRDGADIAKKGIDENIRFIKSNQSNLLKGLMGLHASFTIEDKTLEMVKENLPSDIGIHVHLSEDKADNVKSIAKYGDTPLHRFHKYQLLGPKALLGHGVHLTAQEIELLANSKSMLVHNPNSNAHNAVGVAEVTKMLKAGVRLGIGTDGLGQDILTEIKTAYYLQKLQAKDPRVFNPAEVLKAGIYNNSEFVSNYFDHAVGILKESAIADIVITDYQAPTPLTGDNLAGHVLYGFHSFQVTDVIVNGEFVLKNRKFVKIDEEKIFAQSKEQAKDFWTRW